MEISDIQSRLRMARKELKLSQFDVSETMGVFPSVVSKMENGSQEIRSQQLERFCSAYNVNPTWLLLGIGSRFLSQESQKTEIVKDSLGGYENLIDFTGLQRKLESIEREIGELKAKMG